MKKLWKQFLEWLNFKTWVLLVEIENGVKIEELEKDYGTEK